MITFTAAVSVEGSIEAMTRALIEGARPTVRAAAQHLSDEGKNKIADNASRIYSKRASGRSRSKSLLDPDSYTSVARATHLGYQVRFSVGLSDPLFQAKFFTLNFGGASGYPIRAVNAKTLAFPYPTEASAYVFPKAVFWTQRGGKHGTHFYEAGIAEAIDEAMRFFD